METEYKLSKELDSINKLISNNDIDENVYQLLKLLKIREKIVEKIKDLNWNKLSESEKIICRKEDSKLNKKFLKKHGQELAQKQQFKEAYCSLIDSLYKEKKGNKLLQLLFDTLNKRMYVDFNSVDSNIMDLVKYIESENRFEDRSIPQYFRYILNTQILDNNSIDYLSNLE